MLAYLLPLITINQIKKALYEHYKAINDAVDIPQILYNVPSRTGCDLANETIIQLSHLKNIVGVKDATGDLI
jgi:4-hydroxy-tetrahydrodipicolinate synthase